MTHKFHPGTDFQTADGREVEIYKVTDEYIDGRIERDHIPSSWLPDGRLYPGHRGRFSDLVPKPRKVTLDEAFVVYKQDGRAFAMRQTRISAMAALPEGGFIRHIPAEEREICP